MSSRTGKLLRAALLSLGLGLSLSLSQVACTVAPPAASPPTPSAVAPPTVANAGFSGMAQAGPNTYLVVHDTKGHREGPRLGLVEIETGGLRYTPVIVTDWQHPDGRSSDLESACALPDRSGRSGQIGEFLIGESGTWEGKYGRLFHLRLTGTQAEILHAFPLPIQVGSGPEIEGDNYEGLACVPLEGGRILVLLGERGGSPTYPDGLLRLGTLDPAAGTLQWWGEGRDTLPVPAPGAWPTLAEGKKPRAISDLHVDGGAALWAVATADAGDLGPFRSVIYRVGRLDQTQPHRDSPVVLDTTPEPAWILDGLKIEALSGPATAVEGSVLAFGTEDEDLGGTWRGLFPSVPLPVSGSEAPP